MRNDERRMEMKQTKKDPDTAKKNGKRGGFFKACLFPSQ